MADFDLKRFSEINRKRCEDPEGFNHPLDSWSTADWITALVGEVGEMANVVKKLNRIKNGLPGNKRSETESVLRSDFQDELADVFIYLDLLAQHTGVDLGQAVIDKFNRTSDRLGTTIKYE